MQQLTEADWLDLKQAYLALGSRRDLRVLQRHIEHKYRIKLPLDELRIQSNLREWNFAAIEFDKKLDARIMEHTAETLAKRYVDARIKAWEEMHSQVDKLSGIFNTLIEKTIDGLKIQSTASIEELAKFANVMLKIRAYMDQSEIPDISIGNVDNMGIDYSDPAALGTALLNASRMRGVSLEDLREMQEASDAKAAGR